MSYVPVPVIVPPQEVSSRARNLSYKLLEAIEEAQRADSRLTPQEISMALQVAKQNSVASRGGAYLAAILAGTLLLGVLGVLYFALGG